MNETGKKIINAIVYLILALLTAVIIYAAYVEMSNLNEADRIEDIRKRIKEERIEKEKIIRQRDSVKSIQEDSALNTTR